MPRMADAALGVLILAIALYDVFQSVVLPRPSVGKLRVAPWILRPLWVTWRWLGTRDERIDRRENWLGTFGAYSSDVLLLMLGLGAVFLLPVVAIAGLRMIRLEPAGRIGRGIQRSALRIQQRLGRQPPHDRAGEVAFIVAVRLIRHR